MRAAILILSLITCSAITPIAHADNCYSPAEAEAEQGIRIHSELMVISLNCQHMTPRGWKNFYMQYRELVNVNRDLFKRYENTMLKHLKRGGSNGERKLHALRTDFSNKASADVARMRPDVFCAQYSTRIPQVANMKRHELQDWVSSTSRTQQLSHKMCQ